MTSEERVASLHARMDALRRMRERRKTGVIGAASAVLTICLILLVFTGGGRSAGGTVGLYSGAMMLFEEAGGYVLLAVIAFMVGVVITALCFRYRKKHERVQDDTKKERDS